jgi:putative oxidoreductase
MHIIQQTLTEAAVTLLRVSLGIMYLAHSILLKVMTYGLAGTAGYFASIGLPRWLAYVTVAAEAIGGLAILLGIKARWFALALTPILFGAIATAHANSGWVFSAPGGGWEYPAYLIVLSVAQFVAGDGILAVSPSAPLGVKLGKPRTSQGFPGLA